MAPLTPTWAQPSHPEIQEVNINEAEFTSKSLSRVSVPPFGLYAKMSFPPCTVADKPTYATVQYGRDQHLNLNSDLLYINHSCEPSLIFDMASMNIIAGPKGLKPGEELTFFYPSTEWHMDQPFDCLCGKPTCRGRISGAKDMTDAQLEGLWINGHILELREEAKKQSSFKQNGVAKKDPTAQALEDTLHHAEKAVVAARAALLSFAGSQRRGPTSRELSGEMGGDTVAA